MVRDTNHPFLFQGFACALSTKTKGVAEWLKAHQVAFKATASNQRLRVRLKHQNGGVAEWLKAHAWKVCIRETVSRVRIPLPPPASLRKFSELIFQAKFFLISKAFAKIILTSETAARTKIVLKMHSVSFRPNLRLTNSEKISSYFLKG